MKRRYLEWALIVFSILGVLGIVVFATYNQSKFTGEISQLVNKKVSKLFNLVRPSDQQKTRDHNKEFHASSSDIKHYEATRELIPKIVERARKGVVSIAISDYEFTPGKGATRTESKIGTGFIVDPSGLIVTNRHVVFEDTLYTVVTYDNKKFPVTKIIRDPVNDIAFVFIDPKNEKLTPLPLGDSNTLKLGQTVIAIGTPLGEFPGSVTVGVVSGLHRTVSAGSWFMGEAKKYENVIQTDAAINPGNSGGPLINLGGEVIGVNFAKTVGADNISFALPINLVKRRLAEYRKYGRLRQPFLGVAYVMISPLQAQVYGLVPGAFIKRVVPGSPADKAGLKPGDIIVKIDGKQVIQGLTSLLYQHSVGDVVTIEYVRPDESIKKVHRVKVKLVDKAEVIEGR